MYKKIFITLFIYIFIYLVLTVSMFFWTVVPFLFLLPLTLKINK